MPKLDKTGPYGQGSLTGRGLGKCSSIKSNYSLVRENFGAGRRNGRLGVSYIDSDLKQEKTYLENRLQEINQQLNQ